MQVRGIEIDTSFEVLLHVIILEAVVAHLGSPLCIGAICTPVRVLLAC